jgi:hypothetical protein
MHSFYLTFDYSDTTDANCEPIESDRAASCQFLAELGHAVACWDDVIGFMPVRWFESRRRCVVRFVTAGALTQADAVDAAQRYLFDEGGMLGEFVYGAERAYRMRVETEVTVYAVDEDTARGVAEATTGVHSVIRALPF